MKKIGIVTGTRAEYGLLKPIMQSIDKDEGLELCVIVTGMHLEERFGETYKEIEEDKIPIAYRIPMCLGSDTPKEIVHSMSMELEGFSKVFQEAKLDLLIVLGDRFEIEIAALAAVIFRLPIAHIHGGELTEGLIDDVIRHSITKMSTLHFTSTGKYAKRVIQMGEQPERVFNVGALGVENIKKISLLEREELIEKFGEVFKSEYIVVTYHPVTLENTSAESQFQNLLDVLSVHEEYNYVLTHANADAGGGIINTMIEDYVSQHTNCTAFVSMGQVGYLSALKYCTAVMGNSSSGIIEAPTFHIPTLNIGERQAGRVRAETVLDCGYTREEIAETFKKAVSSEFRASCADMENPYEGKETAQTIVNIIKEYFDKKSSIKKKFYTI